MKHPGAPTSAPSWYRSRPHDPTPIEEAFTAALQDFAGRVEREQWFGDSQKRERFRVDFLLRDARLIVELDGHEHHSSQGDREKDAARQRYLTRAGYSVIRFTGREIHKNAERCAAILQTTYRERLALTPVRYRALYVDVHFLAKQTFAYTRHARERLPDRRLSAPSIEVVTLAALEWLHEKSYISVFLFCEGEDQEMVASLDAATRDFARGEVRFSVQTEDMYSVALADHLEAYTHLYDDVFVIADDPIYIASLLELSNHAQTKLIRRANHETSYRGTDLVKTRWQDVDYVIGGALGLEDHEM